MLIVHSDRMGMTNLNSVIQVKLDGNWIRAFDVCGNHHLLAKYDDEKRAEVVFRNLTEQCRLTKGDDVILLPEM